MATPAAPTISAVADAAPVACVLSHVQLVPSCSATAHARRPVRRMQIAQAAVLNVPPKQLLIPHAHSAQILLTLQLPVQPTATVLPGSSAESLRAWAVTSVFLRARGSASQGRGIVAPDLLYALIHRSAWNKNSRKFISRILHNLTPLPPKSPSPEDPHSPVPLELVTPMYRYARLRMRP